MSHEQEPVFRQLSPNLTAVLPLLALGMTTAEIAIALKISRAAADVRAVNLYEIFDTQGPRHFMRTALVIAAIEQGILPPETDLSCLIPPMPFATKQLQFEASLTYPQKGLLMSLNCGLSYKQIAQDPPWRPLRRRQEKLDLHTVNTSVRNLFSKLGVSSRVEALKISLRSGWLDINSLRTRFAQPLTLLDKLTPKEREIFPLIAQGLSNKQIAKALRKEINIVNVQVASFLKKLFVENRYQAALVYYLSTATME